MLGVAGGFATAEMHSLFLFFFLLLAIFFPKRFSIILAIVVMSLVLASCSASALTIMARSTHTRGKEGKRAIKRRKQLRMSEFSLIYCTLWSKHFNYVNARAKHSMESGMWGRKKRQAGPLTSLSKPYYLVHSHIILNNHKLRAYHPHKHQ